MNTIEKKWTFHAKGIWVHHPEDNCYLTAIGSPNFGLRSVLRDTESQLIILTKDPSLITQFEVECQHIFKNGNPVTPDIFKEEERKISIRLNHHPLHRKKIHVAKKSIKK